MLHSCYGVSFQDKGSYVTFVQKLQKTAYAPITLRSWCGGKREPVVVVCLFQPVNIFGAAVPFCPFVQFLRLFLLRKMNCDRQF